MRHVGKRMQLEGRGRSEAKANSITEYGDEHQREDMPLVSSHRGPTLVAAAETVRRMAPAAAHVQSSSSHNAIDPAGAPTLPPHCCSLFTLAPPSLSFCPCACCAVCCLSVSRLLPSFVRRQPSQTELSKAKQREATGRQKERGRSSEAQRGSSVAASLNSGIGAGSKQPPAPLRLPLRAATTRSLTVQISQTKSVRIVCILCAVPE